MTCKIKTTERRKFKRFQVKSSVFVLLGPDFTEFGQIIDISRDGLSFRYLNGTKPLKEPLEIDIIAGDGKFYLERLSLVPITECEDKNGFSVRPLMNRRCVQFGDLMPNQIFGLEYFIRSFTIGKA